VSGSCEYGNELSSFMKGGEFLDQLSDCHLFKDFAPFSQSVFKINLIIQTHIKYK